MGLRRTAERRKLPEVVHHPQRVEPRLLAGDGEVGDVVEHPVVGDAGEREIR
jgi:hypothetical protein